MGATDYVRISLAECARAFGYPEFINAWRVMRLAHEKQLQGLIMAAEGEHRDSAAQRALRAAYDEDIVMAYLSLSDFVEDWREASEGS